MLQLNTELPLLVMSSFPEKLLPYIFIVSSLNAVLLQ